MRCALRTGAGWCVLRVVGEARCIPDRGALGASATCDGFVGWGEAKTGGAGGCFVCRKILLEVEGVWREGGWSMG